MRDLKFSQPSRRSIFFLIIAVSVIVRAAAALYFGDDVEILPGTYDQVSYHKLALRVLGGHGFTFGEDWWPLTASGEPTAHWSFLYTFFLAGVYALFGPHPLAVRLIQTVVVGVLQPLLTYAIAKHVFGWRVGIISAGLSAIYAYFIYYSATLMTEPFYICAILASLYFTMKILDLLRNDDQVGSWKRNLKLSIGLGVCMGAAVLLRQLFLIVIPLLFLVILRRKRQIWFKWLLVTASVVVVMILPFTLYNAVRFDRLVLLNTNAGYAMFWGNHPVHGATFQPILSPETAIYQDLIPPELRHLDEAALDQALLFRGIQFVLDDPGRFMLLSFSRIPAYFKFWPSNDSSLISNAARVLSFGIMLPLMLSGLWIAHFNRRLATTHSTRGLQLLDAFLLVYTAIHILTWALIRYRLPVDAILVVFAGISIVVIGNRGLVKKRGHIPSA